MKRFVTALILAACACQSMASAGDDDIKAVVQARRARKAKAARLKKASDIKLDKQIAADKRDAEVMRQRVMANEAHAAQVQHAINGANANQIQAQSNQIQAQRNAVLAQQNRALLGLAGIPVCSRCGSTGHYACAPLQKSQAVLEHEAMLRNLVP